MSKTALKVISDANLEEAALSYPERASKLTINSTADYLAVGEFVNGINMLAMEIEGSFGPQIEQAHKLHKSLIAERDRHLKPLKTAKATAKGLMIQWGQVQEAKRREEEARLQALARKAEEEAKLAAAIEAEAAGETEEAEAIMAEPVYVPPIIVKKDVPKVAGVQFRTVWKFRITDESKIPMEYLVPDMAKIGQVVRALKGSTTIPGVDVYEEKV